MVTHCSLQAKARVLFGEESRLPCFCLLCILSSLLRMVFHLQPVQATMKDWLLCKLGIAVNFLNLKVNKLNILGYLLVTTLQFKFHVNKTKLKWVNCLLFVPLEPSQCSVIEIKRLHVQERGHASTSCLSCLFSLVLGLVSYLVIKALVALCIMSLLINPSFSFWQKVPTEHGGVVSI